MTKNYFWFLKNANENNQMEIYMKEVKMKKKNGKINRQIVETERERRRSENFQEKNNNKQAQFNPNEEE